jgi:hypothetical protein
MAAISPEEWAQVPVSVLNLIEGLVGRMDKLEQEMAALRTENEPLKEQIARTSANLSQPPSDYLLPENCAGTGKLMRLLNYSMIVFSSKLKIFVLI